MDTTPAAFISRKEDTSMRKNRLLIIDHDLQTCKEIKYNLDSETTEAYYTLSVREGLAELAGKDYDLVVLNASFPETDGMQLLKTLRGLKPMPILILSTSAALTDKLEAFKTGADDYLTKPFETEECLARVYAHLRRFHDLNPPENAGLFHRVPRRPGDKTGHPASPDKRAAFGIDLSGI